MARRSVRRGGASPEAPANPQDSAPEGPRDVAMIVDRTEDRKGFHVLRQRAADRPVELGTVRPLKEGQPIQGELVTLRPRADVPFAFDVKSELVGGVPSPGGPPQVASQAYREGWDAIWGTGTKPN